MTGTRRPSAALGSLAGALIAIVCVVAPSTARADALGVFSIPAGDVATLTHSDLMGCDATEWGYKPRFSAWHILGAKRQTCPQNGPFGRGHIQNPQPEVTIGPFATAQTFRLFLIDEFPTAFTFFSTDHKHTTITPAGHDRWQIAVNDSNFGSRGPFSENAPRPGQGNLRTTVTISRPAGA